MKKRIAILLVCCIAIVFGSTVSAASLDNSQNEEIEIYTIEEMRTIALNALDSDFYMEADNESWDEVVIVKETPLYDLNNNLTSYCFDLVCGQQTAYIVISADSSRYPVRQFSNHATSAYLNVDTEEKMIYNGPGQYYQIGEQGESISNIITGEIAEMADVATISTTEVAEDVVENYKDIADLYITGSILNQPVVLANPTYRNLTEVPIYQWDKGCAPTSMAMILDYQYSGLYSNEEELIEALADYMGTSSTGVTNYPNIVSGTKNTLYACNRSFTSIGYASANIFGYPNRGSSYIVDRAPRTIMYNENDGQHPSLNTFYQVVTMFDISVDQYFYPSKNKGSECRKRIDAMLNALDEKELKIVEATIQAMKAAKETEDA